MATQVEQLRQKASNAWDAFSTEMAKYNEDNLPTPEASEAIDKMRTEAVEAQKAIQSAEDFLKLQAEADSQRGKHRNPAKQESAEGRSRIRSLGSEFVENPAYQDWLKQIAPDGNVTRSEFGRSPTLAFKGFGDLDRRSALITGESSTSAGAFVIADQYPSLTELGRRTLTIRNLVTNLQTGSDTVEYVRVTGETNAASVVAEATATSGSSGVKPESNLTFERVSTPVRTIANWMAASRRALGDAPQMRGLVDAFLKVNLEYTLEDEMVNGDGTGEHFDGFGHIANTQAQAWDTDLFVTMRKAKRKVATVGRRRPTAFLLHPEDSERIDLAKDNVNRFYGQGPFGVTNPVLWGLPIVESEAVTVGTGYVADWSTCVLWDREQSSLYVSDSHQDFFVRNLIAILAEMRAAFGVLKPSAIVEIDLTA